MPQWDVIPTNCSLYGKSRHTAQTVSRVGVALSHPQSPVAASQQAGPPALQAAAVTVCTRVHCICV